MFLTPLTLWFTYIAQAYKDDACQKYMFPLSLSEWLQLQGAFHEGVFGSLMILSVVGDNRQTIKTIIYLHYCVQMFASFVFATNLIHQSRTCALEAQTLFVTSCAAFIILNWQIFLGAVAAQQVVR